VELWSAPGSVDGGVPVAVAASRAATVRSRSSPMAILPPLRPLRPLQMIDGGFALLRARPGQVMSIAAAFVIPTELLGAFIQRNAVGSLKLSDVFNQSESTQNQNSANLTLVMATWMLSSAALPFVAAAVGRLVVADRLGIVVSTREAIGLALSRWWALLASWALLHVVYAAGVFCFLLPGVLLMGLYIAVAPVIALERLGPIAAIRRSQSLCRRRYWTCVGVGVASALVTGALSTVLRALPQVLGVFTLGRWGWLLAGIVSAATTLVTAPVVAATTVLLYLDLRVRTEGVDIEMDMTRSFGTDA
jgi:hypothetical protein